jgi:hypothetical protein
MENQLVFTKTGDSGFLSSSLTSSPWTGKPTARGAKVGNRFRIDLLVPHPVLREGFHIVLEPCTSVCLPIIDALSYIRNTRDPHGTSLQEQSLIMYPQKSQKPQRAGHS